MLLTPAPRCETHQPPFMKLSQHAEGWGLAQQGGGHQMCEHQENGAVHLPACRSQRQDVQLGMSHRRQACCMLRKGMLPVGKVCLPFLFLALTNLSRSAGQRP